MTFQGKYNNLPNSIPYKSGSRYVTFDVFVRNYSKFPGVARSGWIMKFQGKYNNLPNPIPYKSGSGHVTFGVLYETYSKSRAGSNWKLNLKFKFELKIKKGGEISTQILAKFSGHVFYVM